jgi:hypothetical protein
MEWLSRKTSIAYADVGAIFARGYPKFGAGMTLYSTAPRRLPADTAGTEGTAGGGVGRAGDEC